MEKDLFYISLFALCLTYHFYRIVAMKKEHLEDKIKFTQKFIKQDEELMDRVIKMESMLDSYIPKKK